MMTCLARNPGEPAERAVAIYSFANGNQIPLCQRHLDIWLDNADDDPTMEPSELAWLAAAYRASV